MILKCSQICPWRFLLTPNEIWDVMAPMGRHCNEAKTYWGLSHYRFLALNSNSMNNLPCCNSVASHKIATNFAHVTTTQMACHVHFFCSDHCIRIEVRGKRNFHPIWIAKLNGALDQFSIMSVHYIESVVLQIIKNKKVWYWWSTEYIIYNS